MDERDLYLALAPRHREAGLAFLKQAGVLADITLRAAKHPKVIGGLLGAAIVGGSEVVGNRKNPKTGKTLQQAVAERALASANELDQDSMAGGVSRASAQAYKSLADVFAKHPRASALAAAGAGAGVGARLAPRLQDLFRKAMA